MRACFIGCKYEIAFLWGLYLDVGLGAQGAVNDVALKPSDECNQEYDDRDANGDANKNQRALRLTFA